ncbi:MAG: DNA-3-methyladenine glycosylase [Candidatus Dojkabacteria bacterium]
MLAKSFFAQNTVQVARDLLGMYLVHETETEKTVGKIVETEAYLAKNDPACHAATRKTVRNDAMFRSPGTIYVYLSYGMYILFNIKTGVKGHGEAVLIRAIEPVEGVEVMMKRRMWNDLKSHKNQYELTNGPGKLVLAMGITMDHYGCSATNTPLYVTKPTGTDPFKIITTTRIGIKKGCDLPLRFYIAGNGYVSKVI